MKTLNKKGNINGLQSFIMGIVGIAVVLAVGFIILAETRGSIALCATGRTYNETSNLCMLDTNTSNTVAAANQGGAAVTTMMTKMSGIPNWVGILIVVALASMVLAYFYVRQ